VLHYFDETIATEANSWILLQKTRDERFAVFGYLYIIWELKVLVLLDALEHRRLVLLKEWRLSDQHFIGQCAEGPPINWERMTIFL